MPMTLTPKMLRVPFSAGSAGLKQGVQPDSATGRKIGVDMEKRIIYGYCMAEEGWFKSEDRGQFTRESLQSIMDCFATDAKPKKGLRSRYTHPGMSDDGLGLALGRAKDPWIDKNENIWRARADLHISDMANESPKGKLGDYVLGMANDDPELISSSLVLEPELAYPINKDGTRQKLADGTPIPPVWICKKLMASDIVEIGDAVNQFLSAKGVDLQEMPDFIQRQAWSMLDKTFGDAPRDVIEARLGGLLDRYFALKSPVLNSVTVVAPAEVLTGFDAAIATTLGANEALQKMIEATQKELKAITPLKC